MSMRPPVIVPARAAASPLFGTGALIPLGATCYATPSRSPSPAPSTRSGGSRSPAPSLVSDTSLPSARSAPLPLPRFSAGAHGPQSQTPYRLVVPFPVDSRSTSPAPRSTTPQRPLAQQGATGGCTPSFGATAAAATPSFWGHGAAAPRKASSPAATLPGTSFEVSFNPAAWRASVQRAQPSSAPPSSASTPRAARPRARSVSEMVAQIEGRLAGQKSYPDACSVNAPSWMLPTKNHPQFPSQLPAMRREQVITAGDVLFVKGNGRVAQIGTNGGFMGHVLVALGRARALDPTTVEAAELSTNCPLLRGVQIWRVETLESCRQRKGLHQSEMLIRIDPVTGCVLLVGELCETRRTQELVIIDEEEVQVWQSPPELRSQLQSHLVSEVLGEMKAFEQDWSFATAARAVLKAAPVRAGRNRSHLLEELQACWHTAPICTSIVIVFWQRYLCLLAAATGKRQIDLILRCMPLKADRGLPGELIDTMRGCGWVVVEHMQESQLWGN